MKATLNKIVTIQQKLVENYNDIQTTLNEVSYTDEQHLAIQQRLDNLMEDLDIQYTE